MKYPFQVSSEFGILFVVLWLQRNKLLDNLISCYVLADICSLNKIRHFVNIAFAYAKKIIKLSTLIVR